MARASLAVEMSKYSPIKYVEDIKVRAGTQHGDAIRNSEAVLVLLHLLQMRTYLHDLLVACC